MDCFGALSAVIFAVWKMIRGNDCNGTVMKRSAFVLAVALLLGTAEGSAQCGTTFGVKAEANVSGFTFNHMPGYGRSLGVGAGFGGFLKIDFGEYFALQPELIFDWRNSELKVGGTTNRYVCLGMEVPVYAMGQLRLRSGDRAYVGIGPWLSLGVSAKNTTTDMNLYRILMRRGDVGAALQIGYEFAFGMQVNASYKYGLFNRLSAPENGAFMRREVISLGIAYRF